MRTINTANENGTMSAMGTAIVKWLRRRPAVLVVLVAVAAIAVAALGAIGAHAQPKQAAVAPFTVQPSEHDAWYVSPTAPAASVSDARAHELSMNHLRDVNEAAAPPAAVRDARAYELSMNHLRDINEAAAPAAAVRDARAYDVEMNRLRNINELYAPSEASATGALAPQRDAAQRPGPY